MGAMAKGFCMQLAASSQPLQGQPGACDILGFSGSGMWEKCGPILTSFSRADNVGPSLKFLLYFRLKRTNVT